MNCCSLCIGDRHLQRQIFPSISTETGTCDYCRADNQQLVRTQELRDLFELVVSVYNTSESGHSLASLLAQDWAMFNDTRISRIDANRLISDILDDPTCVDTMYAPSSEYESDSVLRWNTFREELMYSNRYFPTSDIDQEQLKSLLPHLLLVPDEIGAIWWRVRSQEGDATFPIAEMGAPEKLKTSHGRANPAGIPYLYIASNATTAIAEIRPHTGELVTVAEFEISTPLAIIDLATPRQTVSPFTLEDEGAVAKLRADVGFLEQLGDELSRPVVPKKAAFAYTPSQYLCEFIKKCGYDGVRYNSSVGNGTNIALFKTDAAIARLVCSHRVTEVSIQHEKVATDNGQ